MAMGILKLSCCSWWDMSIIFPGVHNSQFAYTTILLTKYSYEKSFLSPYMYMHVNSIASLCNHISIPYTNSTCYFVACVLESSL